MAWVVFLRGVNVGGHKTFRPTQFAKELADFGVVNVGAAGTFVVRGKIGEKSLRAELVHRLPFKAEIILCSGRDLIDLANRDPFQDAPSEKEVRRFVTVMQKAPRATPRFPVEQPAGDKWEVKVIALSGRFALSLWRRQGKGILYPNAVVEEQFNTPATTRSWNTIITIRNILEE